MQTPTVHHRIRRQRGFSMIEVLIAMLVLAIGLLGMAQMQASGIRSTHGAYLRTQATLLAGDILDSMRANLSVARSAGYDAALTATYTTPSDAVAGADVDAWKANLAALLPNGDGTIASNGSDITVTVQWTALRNNENAGAGQTKSFSVDTTL